MFEINAQKEFYLYVKKIWYILTLKKRGAFIGKTKILVAPRGEPRLELGVHVFGIMWNYFGIH